MTTVRSTSRPPVRGSASSASSLDHVGHLVAALAAPDVDDDVGVAPLGDLLQQHGLAGAEAARAPPPCCPGRPGRAGRAPAARSCSGTAASSRSRNGRGRRTGQRPASGTSVSPTRATTASAAAHGPGGAQPGHRAATARAGPARGAARRRRRPPCRAGRRRPRRTAAAPGRLEAPLAAVGRADRRRRSRSQVPAAGQRPQQPVEDAAEQAGPEPGRQRLPRRHDRVARAHRPPVYSYACTVSPVPSRIADHLAGQPRRPELDQVGHGHAGEALDLDQRTGRPGRRARCVTGGRRLTASTAAPPPGRAAVDGPLGQRRRAEGRSRRPPASATTPPSGASARSAPGPSCRAGPARSSAADASAGVGRRPAHDTPRPAGRGHAARRTPPAGRAAPTARAVARRPGALGGHQRRRASAAPPRARASAQQLRRPAASAWRAAPSAASASAWARDAASASRRARSAAAPPRTGAQRGVHGVGVLVMAASPP